MRVLPIGTLNFQQEDIIEILIEENHFSWSDIIKLFSDELINHPNAREEYCDGGHPKIYLTINKNTLIYKGKQKKYNQIKPSLKRNISKLVNQYVNANKMQWGEVLYTVFGYLNIHRPDAKDCDFSYTD